MLGNPVPGYIQARTETWDGVGFIVTSTFAEHVASGRGPGIDIGNSHTGAEVRSMADGVITFAGQISTGIGMANVVRIWHPDLSQYFGGQRVESGYAHLLSIEVTKLPVARGQAIGHVGASGATAPHLHGGFKVGGSATVEGTEIDWWPLLDQVNPPPATGDDMLQGTNPKQLNNKIVTITGDSTRLRAAPATGTTPVLAVYGAGTNFTPDWEVTGAAVGASAQWFGGWGVTAKGIEFGYLHTSVVGPLTPFEQAGGHTDAELAAAAAAAKKAGETAGYNEGRSAVQGAAMAVPAK